MTETQNLSKSLRYINNRFGKQIFLNEKTMFSMLSDLIPKNKKEINWVIESINCGMVKVLVMSNNNEENIQKSKKEAEKILRDNEISRDRSEYLLNCFYYALGWTNQILTIEQIKLKNKKDIKNSVKKGSVNKSEGYDSIQEKSNNQKSDSLLELNKSNRQRIEDLKDSYKNAIKKIKKDRLDREQYPSRYSMMGIFYRGILNVIIFLICISITYSYIYTVINLNNDKYIIGFSLVSIIISIKLFKRIIKNYTCLIRDINKIRIHKKSKSIEETLNNQLKKIEIGSVLTINDYKSYSELLVSNLKYIDDLEYKWKQKILSKYNLNYHKVNFFVVLLIGMFLISANINPAVINNYSNPFHNISRFIIDEMKEAFIEKDKKNHVYIISDTSNVRVKPDISSDLIEKVKRGRTLKLSDSKEHYVDGKSWYKVELENGIKGWIQAFNVKVIPQYVYITAEQANVRGKASLSSDVVKILNEGSELETTGNAKKVDGRIWFEVYIDGVDGNWVSSNIVE